MTRYIYRLLSAVLLVGIYTVSAEAQQVVFGDDLTITDQASLSGTVGHPDYVSQLARWRIDSIGGADFRYLFADELHVKSFIADLEQALAGGQIISKSVAMLASNYTVPNTGAASTITVRDLPSAENMAVFETGDTIRLRSFSRASGSLTVADAYGVVTAYADQPGGVQTWTFTRNAGASGGGMAGGSVIQADALVLDYGVSGNGFHEVNAIDGAYGLNSPYAQVVTWIGAPVAANLTVRTRIGNLRGVTGVSNEYGAILGTYATTNGQYVRVSNQAVELHGVNLQMWDGGTNVIRLDRTAPSFAIGSPVPAGYASGTGIWMGNDGGTYKFRVGNPVGNRVEWDGSNLNVVGTITATSGTIGGWSIGATALTSGTGSTRVGLDSGGTNPAIYAGSSIPGTAPFRVTNAGALTATSGQIGGWTLGATSLTAGSGSTTVGLDSGGTNPRFYAGSATPGSAPFRVAASGALTATNATLTGSLSAGGGAVTIDSNGIQISQGTGNPNAIRWSDGASISSSADNIVIESQDSGGTAQIVANTTAFTFSVSALTAGNNIVDWGSTGSRMRTLYLATDLNWNAPPTTDFDDYPMVYSTSNTKLYRKTDGFNGTCTSPSSIVIERGIVVGCS